MSGHFVLVKPTPLPRPSLVLASEDMCRTLQLDHEACSSDDFVRLFSGGSVSERIPGFDVTWATPYALSIYGQEVQPNGAGAHGYGYGDGRAISIGEVALSATERYELQLKGAGRTPFCRGADGRAVLRSSAREFLASEAMHALGVPTTRALALVVSGSESVLRPWYANASAAIALGAHAGERHGGDVTRRERCAITTRVARSFVRVGQLELYARRARTGDAHAAAELEALVRHVLAREYARVAETHAGDLRAQILGMAAEATRRFATLAAEWIRVGYTQSNFNADNCLVGGATVDYGPFGFVEAYEPGWVMWIGGGEHFSFGNQPRAAGENLKMLLRSLEPLLEEGADVAQLRALASEVYPRESRSALGRVYARKLGLRAEHAEVGHALFEGTHTFEGASALLRKAPTDWTLFWRQLAEVPAAAEQGEDVWMRLLAPAFYEPPAERVVKGWRAWLRRWLDELRRTSAAHAFDGVDVGDAMRSVSPKYVPREWMLVAAYTDAERGEYGTLREMHELLRRPYDEQPAMAGKFYRRRPAGAELQGGVGFMS